MHNNSMREGTSTPSMSSLIRVPSHAKSRSRRWWQVGLWLMLQMLLVCSVEIADDLFRGNVVQPDARQAMSHAIDIMRFESVHGLFIEPSVQLFFRQPHHVLGLSLTWTAIVWFANTLYAVCHLLVFGALLIWIYVYHRRHFALIRSIALLADCFAVLVYELYPTAPPRLTPDIHLGTRSFQFQDTMHRVIGGGQFAGTHLGYNQFSAMPSLHIAWALIAGLAIVMLAESTPLRIAGALYPGIMLFAVVVSGNHFILDALGSIVIVALAFIVYRLWHATTIPRVMFNGIGLGAHPIPVVADDGQRYMVSPSENPQVKRRHAV